MLSYPTPSAKYVNEWCDNLKLSFFFQDSLLDKLEEVKPEAAQSPDEEVNVSKVKFRTNFDDVTSIFLCPKIKWMSQAFPYV